MLSEIFTYLLVNFMKDWRAIGERGAERRDEMYVLFVSRVFVSDSWTQFYPIN